MNILKHLPFPLSFLLGLSIVGVTLNAIYQMFYGDSTEGTLQVKMLLMFVFIGMNMFVGAALVMFYNDCKQKWSVKESA